jgi:hypothetical protein
MFLVNYWEADFDTVPVEEEGAQAGFEMATECQIIEARVMKAQVERIMGTLPEGATLRAKRIPYEEFSYYELRYRCDDADEEAVQYGFLLEREWPLKWDEVAREELLKAGYWEKLAQNRKRVAV